MMMMIRTSGKLMKAAAMAATRRTQEGFNLQKPFFIYYCSPSPSPSPSPVRFYGSNSSAEVDPVSLQMINYALSHARLQRSDESYAQGLLVLEQCLSSTLHDGAAENTSGVVLLAMSNLLSERGDFGGAMEKLEKIQDLTNSSLGVRVAAMEGLIGLNLELGQDDTSAMLADKCLESTNSEHGGTGGHVDGAIQLRAKAIKGLVELVLGNHGTAEHYFGGTQEDEGSSGNSLLTNGELLHSRGDFALAKEFYHKAIQGVPEKESFDDTISCLAAANMISKEVLLGANCALGQLEAHSGNFADAEDILTKALTNAEEHFGSHHPKVGVILTCIALMFRHKAQLERSSSILIQEGLYRRALEMLKAPSLETEGEAKIDRRDIVALARGGYADILCVQQNRKAEGERMKKWAESTWRNRRMSLAEALEISDPCKVAVVDTRISRVL